MHVDLPDEAACMVLAQQLAAFMQANDILALNGELGSGKTTFVRALVVALDGDASAVHSPTYALLHSYAARIPIIHIDAYRLQGEGDLESLGFSELSDGAIACIEWAQRLDYLDPAQLWTFSFEHAAENTRSVEFIAPPKRNVILNKKNTDRDGGDCAN